MRSSGQGKASPFFFQFYPLSFFLPLLPLLSFSFSLPLFFFSFSFFPFSSLFVPPLPPSSTMAVSQQPAAPHSRTHPPTQKGLGHCPPSECQSRMQNVQFLSRSGSFSADRLTPTLLADLFAVVLACALNVLSCLAAAALLLCSSPVWSGLV